MVYSEKFKEKVVARIFSPGSPSIPEIAAEVGVNPGTLYRWRRDSVLGVLDDETPPDNQAPKSRAELTTIDKVRLISEASKLSDDERGAFLRRNGLHQAELDQWMELLQEALDPSTAKKRRADEKKLVASLEKELRRKDKALAEAAALLVLRKKAHALWGDEDDDTEPT